MNRYIVRELKGGWFGVWNVQERCYCLREGFGFVSGHEEAEAECAQLQMEHDNERFGRFVVNRLEHRADKKAAMEFDKEFRRWFRETNGRRLARTETIIGYDREREWFLRYAPKSLS